MIYKKKAAGTHRNPSVGLIINQPQYIYNKYKPGGTGVGAVSTACRRALNRNATICNERLCGSFYTTLGLKNYPNQIQPRTPILEGTFIFSFVLTSIPDPVYYIRPLFIHENINVPIPINNNNGDITYTYNVNITGNYFLVTISYKVYSATTNDGISFDITGNHIINFFNNHTSNLTIIQFGDMPLGKNGSQFANLNSLTFSPTSNAPTLYPGTSLSRCFKSCQNFNSHVYLWNLKNTTNMSYMFNSSPLFNQPLATWDTSFVTNMEYMFAGATSFNQNLETWNTSNVLNMSHMFDGATSFNQPINPSWDVSNVTDMSFMFRGATLFNQPVNSWDTSKVTTMESMFQSASSFNKAVDNWNTSNVTNMASMFRSATAFNQAVNNFDTSNVTTMDSMFLNASSFNQSVNNFDTSQVSTMQYMFQNATAFNQPVNLWNTSNVTSMQYMFAGASAFNQNVTNFDTSKVTTMAGMFLNATLFNQNVNNFNTFNVTNMAYMFQNATSFNQDVDNWNTSNVTTMTAMFQSAILFNKSLSTWNTSNVTNMASMFQNSPAFNQYVNNFNTSNVTNMSAMFSGASAFNQDVNNFDTSNVTTMQYMFQSASAFNQNINNFNLSNVTTTQDMFNSAFNFNNGQNNDVPNVNPTTSSYNNTNKTLTCPGATFLTTFGASPPPGSISLYLFTNSVAPYHFTFTVQSITDNTNLIITTALGSNIGSPNIRLIQYNVSGTSALNWNMLLVTNMSNMFFGAIRFNQNVNSLISIVNTTLSQTFQDCYCFNNGDLIGSSSIPLTWSTSNVINMTGVFRFTPLNQSLSSWATNNVTSMFQMFFGASAFNQNINNFNLSNVTTTQHMFNSAFNFNNGQNNDVPNVNPTTSSYVNGTKTLTCPGATFLTTFGASPPPGSISLYLYANTAPYHFTFTVQSITDNTNLIITTALGSNIGSPNIRLIQYNVSGTSAITWNMPLVTNMTNMFFGALRFNQNVNSLNPIVNTTLSQTFRDCYCFNNGDVIGSSSIPLTWSTTNVINMTGVFRSTPFNQSLSSWTTNNVTTMFEMFYQATRFNQNIGLWNVNNVLSFQQCFYQAFNFNNGSSSDIQAWSAPKATSFNGMFSNATSFNQPLPNLVDTSSVVSCNLQSCVASATSFNQNIGAWNLSNVTNMSYMFASATSFNNGESSDIQNWSAPKCTTFTHMFNTATKFNQPLPNLVNTANVSSCNLSVMFNNANIFNNGQQTTIPTITPSTVTCTGSGILLNCPGASLTTAIVPIGSTIWVISNLSTNVPNNFIAVVSGITPTSISFVSPGLGSNINIGGVFNVMFPTTGNASLNSWNTTNVTTMANMFTNCFVFNQNISNWNVSNVTDMSGLFNVARTFNNGDLINASNVTLNSWNTSKVTTFVLMFSTANSFNQTIGSWNTSIVQNMNQMFTSARNFNQPIGSWNTSNVQNMNQMFQNSASFNQDIGLWNVSNVTIMTNMFLNAINFNNGASNSISSWQPTKCTTFGSMFSGAFMFNQPLTNLLNGLTVTTNTSSMFQTAYKFNQNLNLWDMTKTTTIDSMFNSGGTTPTTVCTFNNGELGYVTISGTPSSALYTNTTKVLTCSGALFLTELTTSDVLIITTSAVIYSSAIQSITDNTTLFLVTPYGSNLNVGTILSITKQIPGTAPLLWNLTNTTNMANAFRNCTYFNQNVSTTVSKWNINNVTSLNAMFQGGSTTVIHLFNNGQILTGTTAPLNWVFNVAPISTNWRQNCRLTTANVVTTPALP